MNTPVIAMFLHDGTYDMSYNLSTPIVFTLPYLDVSIESTNDMSYNLSTHIVFTLPYLDGAL